MDESFGWSFFQTSHNLLFVAGLDGSLRVLNGSLERFFGHDTKAMEGMALRDRIHPSDRFVFRLHPDLAPRVVALRERGHHRVEVEAVRRVDPVAERHALHRLRVVPEEVLEALVEHPERAVEARDE